MQIYKIKGREYKPTRLTAKQALSVILYSITGIQTEALRDAIFTRHLSWAAHARGIQQELDKERRDNAVLSGLNYFADVSKIG